MSETDIVARLRSRPNDAPIPAERLMDEAADEIERLRAALRDAKAWLEGEGLYDQADAIGLVLGDVNEHS